MVSVDRGYLFSETKRFYDNRFVRKQLLFEAKRRAKQVAATGFIPITVTKGNLMVWGSPQLKNQRGSRRLITSGIA
jgi:hypothetical protein